MDARQVRRKIIKGSLAAPMVLTVSSASATAMTSFGRCLRRGAGFEPDPPFFARGGQGDGWFRRQVDVVDLAFKGQKQGEFYLDPLARVYIDTRAPHNALQFGSALPDGWRATASRKRWALVYFHEKSTAQFRHVTLQKPSGYKPATVSCYSSFRV